MPEALINPDIIVWARSRSQIGRDRFAKEIKASLPQVDSWESGSSRPSLSTAMRISKALKIPFGYLFLTTPPANDLIIPDFRTMDEGVPRIFTSELRDVLESAVLKQQWFEKYLQEKQDVGPLWERAAIPAESDLAIATSIRDGIGWSDETRRESSTPGQYLAELTKKAEAFGILVLRSGVVGSNNKRTLAVAEFRGFTLAASRAPVIFINANDAKSAQVFTFAHELAHVWLGISGVSDPERVVQEGTIFSAEALCNSVAAELVAPRVSFRSVWLDKKKPSLVAAHFRVSEIVVLRRALELHLLTNNQFKQAIPSSPHRPVRKGKGGNFHASLYARNSTLFTTTLLGQVKRGSTGYREAARLLSVKPVTVSKLQTPKRTAK